MVIVKRLGENTELSTIERGSTLLPLWINRESADRFIMLLVCSRRMVTVEQVDHRLDQINRQGENDGRVFLNSDFRERLKVAQLQSSGLCTNDGGCLRQLVRSL